MFCNFSIVRQAAELLVLLVVLINIPPSPGATTVSTRVAYSHFRIKFLIFVRVIFSLSSTVSLLWQGAVVCQEVWLQYRWQRGSEIDHLPPFLIYVILSSSDRQVVLTSVCTWNRWRYFDRAVLGSVFN
jgi:hypothetical protein